jgi:hypothetical protein
MKTIGTTTAFLVLSMLLCSLTRNASADGCEKSPCRKGDKYDVRQRRCETEPSAFGGYTSHYAPDCVSTEWLRSSLWMQRCG